MMERLEADFFHRDCLEVAPDLVGKLLIRQLPDGTILQDALQKQKPIGEKKMRLAMLTKAEPNEQSCFIGKAV